MTSGPDWLPFRDDRGRLHTRPAPRCDDAPISCMKARRRQKRPKGGLTLDSFLLGLLAAALIALVLR
jgi:hypothetical protein